MLKFSCACTAAGDAVGEELEVTFASDSPGRMVDEDVDVDVLAECVSVEEDEEEENVDKVDGAGAGAEGEGGEGAPVALVILVASTLVVAGAPMVGGRAEEKALEPGVS